MKNLLSLPFAIGLAVIAVLVGFVLFSYRGGRMDLPGKIVKIRTVALDDQHAAAVADFSVTNTSDYPFVVGNVSLIDEDSNGGQIAGLTSSEGDAQRFFEGFPALGTKFNPSLITKETIPGHGSRDRMILATFNFPEAQLQGRKRFIVRVQEIDGRVFDLVEK